MKFIIIASLLIAVSVCLWPQPNKISVGQNEINLSEYKINLRLQNGQELNSHILKQWQKYENLIFQAKQQYDQKQQNNKKQYDIILNLENTELFHMRSDTVEKYKLNIQEDYTEIIAENYVGYIRALETFSQLIDQNSKVISKLPILIEDEPYMAYRGIMIDTARHFLTLDTIFKTIDSMQYNKMNALHIHFTDDESFPVQLFSHPEVTNTGAFSEKDRYSREDLKKIVNYAKEAGVRIIPEFDSPSHTRSWGLSEKWAPNMIICPGSEHYNGQLDITMESTYELVNGIVEEIQDIFPDEYVHLGGDEVIYSCYNKRPSIKEKMKEMGFDSYIDLQVHYRKEQKKVLKKGRVPVYWSNEKLNIPPGPTEIINYWGKYDSLYLVKDVPNKLILSPDDFTYINTGQGFVWGEKFGHYITWEKIYDFLPVPEDFPRDRILGAEVCLWSEMNDSQTTENYLWIRAAALAERLWTKEKAPKRDMVKRLVQIQKTLNARGIHTSPVTNQYCSQNVDECF